MTAADVLMLVFVGLSLALFLAGVVAIGNLIRVANAEKWREPRRTVRAHSGRKAGRVPR